MIIIFVHGERILLVGVVEEGFFPGIQRIGIKYENFSAHPAVCRI